MGSRKASVYTKEKGTPWKGPKRKQTNSEVGALAWDRQLRSRPAAVEDERWATATKKLLEVSGEQKEK